MNTLHVVPGNSAGGSLKQAIRDAGHDADVLPFPDDPSCGPIDSDEPSARAIWWAQFYEDWGLEPALRKFWERIFTADNRLVVWFGRHSARELAFFLTWADRLGERPYQIIDVTGRQRPFKAQDGSTGMSQPARSVSIVPSDALQSLLGTERSITSQVRDESRQSWRRLRRENAPFRIVTEAGLASTSIDYFDPLLLAQATAEWQKAARIVGNTMAHNSDPYFQSGDLMLYTRVVALIEEGRLIADGEPRDMSCRIRLQQNGNLADSSS
jgi:Protein of unknown function/Domain of unknown function (DUF1835)